MDADDDVTKIDLRTEHLKQLNAWWRQNVIEPEIEKRMAAGLSREESVYQVNRAVFIAFRGMHGFPVNDLVEQKNAET